MVKFVNNSYLYNTLDIVRYELMDRNYQFFVDEYDSKIEISYKHNDDKEAPHSKFVIEKYMFVGNATEIYSRLLHETIKSIVACGLCNEPSKEEIKDIHNKLMQLSV